LNELDALRKGDAFRLSVFDDWYYNIHDLLGIPEEREIDYGQAPYRAVLNFVRNLMDNCWWEDETDDAAS
jgi:hypothetical protein